MANRYKLTNFSNITTSAWQKRMNSIFFIEFPLTIATDLAGVFELKNRAGQVAEVSLCWFDYELLDTPTK